MVFVEKTKYCRFYLLRKYQDDCKSNDGVEEKNKTVCCELKVPTIVSARRGQKGQSK